jgi:hypothetical protein
MIPESLPPSRTEFHSRTPENLLLVENGADGGVVIRAAVDNFSAHRKALFIRELASEGFISGRFQSAEDMKDLPGIRWVVDNSWLVVAAQTVVVSWRGVCDMYLDTCMGAALTAGWRSYRHWC